MDQDVYFKKTVPLRHAGRVLRFNVANDLFSSHQVDFGSRFLLRTLERGIQSPLHKVLDMGAGYGPIGLALKAAHPQASVHLVDRDALAVDYSRQNAELNQVHSVEAYGSLGYDDVRERDFDLIVANLPGKARERVLELLLLDAAHSLKPAGMMAVVVVAPLAHTVASVLEGSPGIAVSLEATRSGHAVFHYGFSNSPRIADVASNSSIQKDVYRRGRVTVRHSGISYELETADGLPEFEAPSYATQLLMEAAAKVRDVKAKHVAVFNPGQGHVPVALWKLLAPASVSLVDRDLLALRYSRSNLLMNGCSLENTSAAHQVGTSLTGNKRPDVVAAVLREREGPGPTLLAFERGAEQLSPQGHILVAGSSTAVTRLAKAARSRKVLRIVQRTRRKGSSALVLKRR